jgi:hypothetical protein
VWNAWNRQPLFLKAGDSTATWSYLTNTVRAARGDSTNSLTIFSGLAEEPYELTTTAVVVGTAGLNQLIKGQIGIGYNSTTTMSGRTGETSITNFTAGSDSIGQRNGMYARHFAAPALGINVITALESGLGADVATWNGTEASMQLAAQWRG